MNDEMKAEFSNLVKFVKSSSNSLDLKSSEEQITKSKSEQFLSGNDAVQIYKDIISSHSSKSKGIQNSSIGKDHTPVEQVQLKHQNRGHQFSKHPGRPSTQCCLNVQTLLTCSQNGDLAKVKECLTNDVDIDSQDQFGWTALMCAACSGQSLVVKHLLANGANKHLTATGEKTAASIASDAGHCDVMRFISEFDPNKPEVIEERTQSSPRGIQVAQPFYCDVCKQDIKETSQINHQASTVHLFNMKMKASPHSFLEHSKNKGYQIMRRTGWDGEKGLGSEGQGLKFPIKTVLRKDRACLGSDTSKEKAKITHFGPRDISAVKRNVSVSERKMSARTLSKRARKAKERKEKQWEKNLRQQFNLN
ncbi:G patch domain and ankyrin repeat-containing protein 1 homolog [Ylistrum balloti]|uniref:G patch domain and ankyrin repeat-containing protein 1 homolog n=1 Tax=Ylistrum balloti TaxID=509963 RepID=UPI002905C8C6|nr:G patch domain and ankyrin repeat-containing protein 1 homolog [Ylistrum balloti]